mmetsp:Transcript_102016/g.197500  ORF Transcript_102016/g.197500 Transcript_102016/m.197500 type:complete len:109 (-) Transcript_102016:19-345(-)
MSACWRSAELAMSEGQQYRRYGKCSSGRCVVTYKRILMSLRSFLVFAKMLDELARRDCIDSMDEACMGSWHPASSQDARCECTEAAKQNVTVLKRAAICLVALPGHVL